MSYTPTYSEARPGVDPGRGSFNVKPTKRGRRPLRPGKTKQDRMPVADRPRVQKAQEALERRQRA